MTHMFSVKVSQTGWTGVKDEMDTLPRFTALPPISLTHKSEGIIYGHFMFLRLDPFTDFPRAAFCDGPFHDETVGNRWDKIIDKYGKKNWLACN